MLRRCAWKHESINKVRFVRKACPGAVVKHISTYNTEEKTIANKNRDWPKIKYS